MPNPRKPAHLKAIAGTAQPCRKPEPSIQVPALSAPPKPVDWLPNAHAKKEWNRLAPLLVANGLLSEADLSTFGHMCALHGKLVQLWSAGESPTGHMLAQYNALASAFGLAAAWRGKVKPSGEAEKANPFARNGKPVTARK